ncbi:hypothetical protein ACJQWK_01094 [Exserohilum turcicum]|uniref:Hydrophobin n=1 Tax=Exserohilum turcicum (strain 28A) TaxID=671987 RepID=R0K297_EXST2|nr:uncharacterized protein SETTUDRAFT_21093 [Exserohilum turcica Et28A]EOA83739.1 hypothetical protein SETTUDRAFT_21093 [Exserohilum turcica Et28A]
MFTKTIILALAAVAAAVPNVARQDNCGANSKFHCCDSATAKKIEAIGVIPITDVADLHQLLGQCNAIVPIIPIVSPNKQCTQNAICCGEYEQNGLINLGCTPISL